MIAGKSTGSITSCTIKGKLTIANSYPRAISSNYFGFAKAVSHLNIGNYSSLSKGVITNNTSTLIYSINNKTNQKYEDGNSFFNIYEEFNYIENIK